MRFILLGLFSAGAFLLGGCSSTWQYVKAPNQGLKVADTSKARIYLIRADSGSKMASTRISDNGVLIGNTGPGGYLCWEREPGKMRITSVSAGEAAAELTVAAGGVYYVTQRVDPGWVYGKSSLTIVPEETGLALVSSCKPAYVTLAEPSSQRPRTAIESFKPVAGGGPPRGGGVGGVVSSGGVSGGFGGIVINMRSGRAR
jgi:uncharacterized protein DUF2846